MATATLKKQWQVANNGGWAETFSFFLGTTATPDDITGCSAELNLIRPGRPTAEVLTFRSTDNPARVVVTGSPAAVNVTIPESVTIGWPPGAYDVQLRVIPASPGVDRYNLVGPGRLVVIEAPGT